MRTRLEAGAEFDFLDKNELHEALDNFAVKLTQGLKHRRIEMACPIVNNRATQNGIGPDPGFVWGITFVSAYWYHTADSTLDAFTIFYRNEENPSRVLTDITSGNQIPSTKTFDKQAMVIHPGETVVAQIWDIAAITDASPTLYVSMHVVEVPTFSEGLLNL